MMIVDGIGTDGANLWYTAMGNPKENNGQIHRVGLDGKNHEIIVPSGSTFTPKQLQVVTELKKIYWGDREGMRVMCCNYDGSDLQTLVQTGSTEKDREDACKWCVGVAVDPKRGKLYWTQKGPSKGNEGRLFSASLNVANGEDATNRTDIKLLLEGLPEPIDLDLDVESNILYMTDRGDPPNGNSISKIQLNDDGVVKKTILIRKLHEAIGLTLDVKNGKMYFTDLNGSLYSADIDGSNEVVLLSEIGDLTGVTLRHL